MEDKWKILFKMAQQKNPNLKEAVQPYADIHVVTDFNGINNGNVNISWFHSNQFDSVWLKGVY